MFVSLWRGSRGQRWRAGQYMAHGDRMRDARVFSLTPDGQRPGVYARGLRNCVGMAVQPGTGEV
jgi:glucose/arabinose dehydrogenase